VRNFVGICSLVQREHGRHFIGERADEKYSRKPAPDGFGGIN
jgi:hypothetical protein